MPTHADYDKRFERMAGALRGIDQRINGVVDTLDAVTSELRDIRTDIESLTHLYEDLNARLERVEAALASR